MIPESRLIKSEITLRELSLPDDILIAKKALIRWIALSFGMVLPNESRVLMLDILDVIFESHVKNSLYTTKEIFQKLQEKTGHEQNPKAIYYHLLNLKECGIIGRKKGRYFLGNGEEKRLKDVFRDIYNKKTDDAFNNIGRALDRLESNYR